MIFPTVVQARVVNKPQDKRITVIDTGRASGKSTALIFKALYSECRDCTIINPTYRPAKYAFQSAYKLLQPFGFRASVSSMILSNDKLNKKIKFARGDDPDFTAGVSRALIMFDRPEHCDIITIFTQVSRARELVFATNDLYYNFIKYKPNVDKEGMVIPNSFIVDYGKSHWSVVLVDIKYLNTSSTQENLEIRRGMFREEVYLVEGNGVEENPHLSEEVKLTFRDLGYE